MAFVRWRGHSAQLLTTVYERGRSRQVLLGRLPEAGGVPLHRRAAIAARWPDLRIDWAAVDRALAAGPPDAPALPPRARTWAETAHDLRTWALTTDWVSERQALEDAARVLAAWAARTPPPTS